MKSRFPHLLRAGTIGSLRLPNRVVKIPRVTGLGNVDGSVSERLVRHYREIARGGTGLVIIEEAYIDDTASKSAHCQLSIASNEHIPGLAWLADVIKDEGSRAGIEISHAGRQRMFGKPPIKSASAVPWPALSERYGSAAIPEELTTSEIEEIIRAFGLAAYRAKSAGFDLIDVQGAHGYLITNFLSPYTNRRTDHYGGSFENRIRLLISITREIRSKIGLSFPLTVSLSGTDYEPNGLCVEETARLSRVLEKNGVDAIHITGGDHNQLIHEVSPMSIEHGHHVQAAETVKREVRVPIIVWGSITTPELGEAILTAGKADFVGLCRALWADQYWTKKALEGCPEDIRPCIRCNEGCLERAFFRSSSVTCAVNPVTGREKEYEIVPATRCKRVLVVGGGPAGMEAAMVARLRGHAVTLYEKRRLGGVMHEGSVPEFKSDLRMLTAYMSRQLEKCGVTVINRQACLDTISTEPYEVAIIATGARPVNPEVAGVEQPFVYNALDILNNGLETGREIVVIGGGSIGTETAIYLSSKGRDVTIIETGADLMHDCTLTDKLAFSIRIRENGIGVLTSHRLEAIGTDGVIITDTEGVQKHVKADSVVIATGYMPRRGLAEQLIQERDIEVYEIGDCVRPGRIYDAIHSAYRTALKV